MKNNKGFTLIELIMVTIILGILAAVAVPRYMGTVNQAEAAAEKAVIDALRAAVENYSTQEFLVKGRYDYPDNPFTLVDVDGYSTSNAYNTTSTTLTDGDGSWAYTVTGTGAATIYHQRRDNTVWAWDYSFADDSDADSDDSGTNIGDVLNGNNQDQVNLQSGLSN